MARAFLPGFGRGMMFFVGCMVLAMPLHAQAPNQQWGAPPPGNPWQAPNAPFGGGMPPYAQPPMQQPPPAYGQPQPGYQAPQPPVNSEAMDRAQRHFEEGMKALEEAGKQALREHSGVMREKGLEALRDLRLMLEKMEQDLERPPAPAGDNYQNL